MFRSANKKKDKDASASISIGGVSPKISAKLGTDGGAVELDGGTKTMTSTIQGGDIKVPTALRGDLSGGGGVKSGYSYSSSSGGGGGDGGIKSGYSYSSSSGGDGGVGTGGGSGGYSYSTSSSTGGGGGGSGGVNGGLSVGGLNGNISTSGTGGSLSGGLNGSSGGTGLSGNIRLGGSGAGSISKSIGGGLNVNGDLTGRSSPSLRSNISASSPNINDDVLRPMSPQTRLICLSRIDEKNALVTLNDRLAAILARNRQLENENQLLNTQLKEGENRLALISKQISAQFEAENDDLRRRLELAEKDKAKLSLELRKVNIELKDALNKIRKLEDEITTLNVNIQKLEDQINELTQQIRKLEEDRARNGKLIDQLTTEKYMLERKLKTLEQDHDTVVMNKVELENQLRNKDGELQMKVQVHQQQYTEMMTMRSADTENAGIKLQAEYENRLALAIRQLRIDCEGQVAANREEQEALYAKREAALRGEMERMSASLSAKGGDLSGLQLKLAALEKKLMALDGENAILQKSMSELEMGWSADKAGFQAERARLEGIIGDMAAERAQLIADYQGLLEIKVALINEISTYRTLLDGEEERLDILIQEGEEQMKQQLENQLKMESDLKSHGMQGGTQSRIITTTTTTNYESRL